MRARLGTLLVLTKWAGNGGGMSLQNKVRTLIKPELEGARESQRAAERMRWLRVCLQQHCNVLPIELGDIIELISNATNTKSRSEHQ